MKILHINRTDIDGGAARGAYWLHNGLQKAGIESHMLTASKRSEDSTVTLYQAKNRFYGKIYSLRTNLDFRALSTYKNRNPSIFSPSSWTPSSIDAQIEALNPDIINLHWIAGGFLTPEELVKFKKPIVWTLRDMWGFTGGCHYTESCNNYKFNCGYCSHLKSQKEYDISRKLWNRKLKAWKNLNITIVAISHWLADCAKESSLFKNRHLQVIHNALDQTIFKPNDTNIAREVLGISPTKKIILFGALYATTDTRKGFHYLKCTLQELANNGFSENTELIVFGATRPQNEPDFGMKTTYMGRLYDDTSIALLYAAADVTLVPSVQEAFGKTAMESLACGTPVVCFDSTGLKDIVEHRKNGYRAKCFSCSDLANGIAWVLEDEQRWQALSHRAKEKVDQEFTLETQAKAYIKLYHQVLQTSVQKNSNLSNQAARALRSSAPAEH